MTPLPAGSRRVFRQAPFSRRSILSRAVAWSLVASLSVACRATESTTHVVTSLTWLVPGNPRNELEAKQAIVARFNDRNADVVAKPQIEDPKDYSTKLEAFIEAGVEPDVLTVDGVLLPKLANRNALFDLVRLARIEGRSGNTFLDQYQPQYLEASRRDSRLFGLPFAARQAVLYVNKTIFLGAGVPLPPVEWENPSWTWTAFLARAHEVARVGTNRRVSQAGVLMTGQHLMWMAWILQNGGRLLNRTLTRSMLDQPEVSDALQWLANLMHKEFVAPLPSDWRNFTFQKGNVAMHVGFTSEFAWFANQIKNNFQWDIYPLPHERQVGTYAEWNYYAVSSRTVAPEKAWRLAKFLASPDGDEGLLQSGMSTPILRGTEPLLVREVTCEPYEREDEFFRLMIFYRDRLNPTQALGRLLVIGSYDEQQMFWRTMASALEVNPNKLTPQHLGLNIEANAPFPKFAAAAGLATLAWG